jgi:hypothetical protein
LQQAPPTLQQELGLGVRPQQAMPRWQQSRCFSQHVTGSGAASAGTSPDGRKGNSRIKGANNLKNMTHLLSLASTVPPE